MLVAHVVFASVAITTGCLRIWPWLRRRHPVVYRRIGRVCLRRVLPAAVIKPQLDSTFWGPRTSLECHTGRPQWRPVWLLSACSDELSPLVQLSDIERPDITHSGVSRRDWLTYSQILSGRKTRETIRRQELAVSAEKAVSCRVKLTDHGFDPANATLPVSERFQGRTGLGDEVAIEDARIFPVRLRDGWHLQRAQSGRYGEGEFGPVVDSATKSLLAASVPRRWESVYSRVSRMSRVTSSWP
ncbi:MAG TPA: hypothetical protein VJT49_19705 [Amycolatopsis sp.]|uniref:hypothetical protein n=1 Tax=Amycolatopsis sp. TaxID=37632 RepID=UPI002B46FD9B|nr:hypothetical protein [Amycolatopsis sp.]HKS47292.1 hypothetical protein [Amycolatopsis sp.]